MIDTNEEIYIHMDKEEEGIIVGSSKKKNLIFQSRIKIQLKIKAMRKALLIVIFRNPPSHLYMKAWTR